MRAFTLVLLAGEAVHALGHLLNMLGAVEDERLDEAALDNLRNQLRGLVARLRDTVELLDQAALALGANRAGPKSAWDLRHGGPKP